MGYEVEFPWRYMEVHGDEEQFATTSAGLHTEQGHENTRFPGT